MLCVGVGVVWVCVCVCVTVVGVCVLPWLLGVCVTVVAVPDTVLKDSVPLVLLLLCEDAEVVVPSVWVPEDQGELGGTPHHRTAAHFGLHT